MDEALDAAIGETHALVAGVSEDNQLAASAGSMLTGLQAALERFVALCETGEGARSDLRAPLLYLHSAANALLARTNRSATQQQLARLIVLVGMLRDLAGV